MNNVSTEDCDDIASALRGDERAFARLVRRYETEIAKQMWRFTRDSAILEELVHDVFVEAYGSLTGYRGDAPFLHWLRRVATRAGYHYWKREARERTRREALTVLARQPAPENPAPSEAAEFAFRALETLEPKDRLVLTLLYFEECDTSAIAERMGWSRTLVKVRAHRARQKLKIQLESAGYGRTRP